MIPQVEKFLVPLLVENLNNEANFEDEEDEESDIVRNSKECLTLIALRPNTILREQASEALERNFDLITLLNFCRSL